MAANGAMGPAIPAGELNARRERHARMRSFGPDVLAQLEDCLSQSCSVVSIRELAQLPPEIDRGVIGMRHDVDHDLERAVRMAEWEAERGWRATYYLLHTEWYYRCVDGPPSSTLVSAAERIAELGHEVGLHNNVIAAALRTGADPRALLEAELGWLRNLGLSISGTAGHGDPLCYDVGFVNRELFAECPAPKLGAPDRNLRWIEPETKREVVLKLDPIPMSEVGLEYEANYISASYYLTDSGGAFRLAVRGPAETVIHAQGDEGPSPLDLLRSAIGDHPRVQILMHPVWWAQEGETVQPRISMPPFPSLIADGVSSSTAAPQTTPGEAPTGGTVADELASDVPAAQAAPVEEQAVAANTDDRPSDSGYDKSYRSGGFGYVADRRRWLDWSTAHYVHAFELAPGSTMLDVGCGDGFWCDLFRELGFRCTGIDISRGGIEVARERYPECEFEIANAEETLFGGARRFDVVFCRAISHLCAKDLLNPATIRVMANMADALSSDGKLLVSYWTTRDRSNERTCADHLVSDLVRLVEPWLDPWRVNVVGNYVQIGARRRAS